MLFDLEPAPGPFLFNRHHNNAPRDAVYVGRGSDWGNPYVVGKDGTREEVIELFEKLVEGNPAFQARIKEELAGKHLECFCAPKACHGDVLLRYANS